jgi:hypothetical protein
MADELLPIYLARPDVKCPACGYDLHGLAASPCPECGARFELGLVLLPAADGLVGAARGWSVSTAQAVMTASLLILMLESMALTALGVAAAQGILALMGLCGAAFASVGFARSGHRHLRWRHTPAVDRKNEALATTFITAMGLVCVLFALVVL